MPDKSSRNKAAGAKTPRKRAGMSPEQRSKRIQTIMFGALAVIMVVSMVISLVAR